MSVLDDDGELTELLLQELLSMWQESLERGEAIDLPTLCRDRPELAEELDRRIRSLNAWDRFTDTVCDTGTGPPPRDRRAEPAPASAQIQLNLTDLRFFAKGGLGVIYSGHDGSLGRDIAVKFAAAPAGTFTDAEMNRRFLREVKVTAALEHPGIVPVHGLGQDAEGRLCYAMRLIAGKTLAKAISEYHATRAGLPPRRRPELRRDAGFRSLLQRLKSGCVTVAYAHSRGFLHRDLKPDHILLGDFDSTWVVDWGLTKSISDPETTPWLPSMMIPRRREPWTQTGIGTLGFASPEQQAGDWSRVGPTSDVYSLGAILYVLLTDQLPFAGQSAAEILRLVETGSLVPPRRRNPEVPPPLEAICLKAMAFRPEDRYPSAQALADDLERWLADAPVAAYPEPWRTRARRTIDRHSLLLLLLFAAAGGGLVTATTGWYRGQLRDVEVRSLAYATAERSAAEQVLTRRPGWTVRGLDHIAEAARIDTSLRSDPALRSLAASCLAGIDLRPVARLTSIPTGCLAFSPDGRRLVVGELFDQGTYRIQQLEVGSGTTVREHVLRADPAATQTQGVRAVAYSPDGGWIGAGLRDGRVMTWAVEDDRSDPAEIGRFEGPVVGLRFTPDGSSLIAASGDGMMLLAERSGDGWVEVRRVRIASSLSDMAVGADGERVVCAADGATVTLERSWLRGKEPLPSGAARPAARVERLAISPDGRRLALSCRSYGTLTIGSEPSPKGLVDPDLGVLHQDETTHLEFCPDGSLIATGSADDTVKLWDLAASRMVLRQYVFSESGVIPVFDPSGRRLAIGTSEGVWLYDVLGQDTCRMRAISPVALSGFDFLPRDQADRPDSSLLVTLRAAEELASPGASVLEAWVPSFPRPILTAPLRAATVGDRPIALEANPNRRQVAALIPSGASILDMSRQPPRWIPAGGDSALLMCFSTDGTRLWVLTQDKDVLSRASDGSGGAIRWRYDAPVESRGRVGISCLAPGREILVAGTLAGRVLRSRPAEGRLEPIARASAPIEAIALSPDESLVACGTQRGGLDLVRLRDLAVVFHAEPHTDRVEQVRFHPSGGFLATLARDRNVILWKLDGDRIRELFRITSPFRRSPSLVRFSPDGGQLGILSAGEHAVHVWDLDRLCREFARLGLDRDDPESGAATKADAGRR